MTVGETTWTEYNQRYLQTQLERVRTMLTRHIEDRHAAPSDEDTPTPDYDHSDPSLPPPALDALSAWFHLSMFERDVLMLCAGAELDGSFAGLCARAQGDSVRGYPTFSLALAALEGAHWSALDSGAPLRRWRLIEVQRATGAALMTSPLCIDERILHLLAGVQSFDERLATLLELVQPHDELVPSHEQIAERITAILLAAVHPKPAIHLCGPDTDASRAVAAAACARLGLNLLAITAEAIPNNVAELEELLRLWEREAILTSSALLIEATTGDESRTTGMIDRLAERAAGPVLLVSRERWRPLRRTCALLDVAKPTTAEQRDVWRHAVGELPATLLNGHLNALAAQFNLSASSIRTSAVEAAAASADSVELASRLWDATRAHARPRLDDLAERIQPAATWNDLVLPTATLNALEEIATQVHARTTVYEAWGFASLGTRGLGITVLFAGPSGTGKTMAAEVLANHLRLDLYRIDLSGVVSKYIGETEKNLRRVFDAAEEGGAILLFDEADALFGKRSEVKDSHDRYANIEINYLLQRMESYRGLAVLATNMKGALDQAFLRRLRFVITFPFPELLQRLAIWQKVFPSDAPCDGLDFNVLARLNLAGGNIRNVALNAAFLAAGASEPIRMPHVIAAARGEYAKLDTPFTAADLGRWQ